MSSFRFKNLQQSDADKLLILLEENRKLKAELSALEHAINDMKDAQRNGDLIIADLEGQIERLQGGGWEGSGV
jgi:hypothetical protein